MKNGFIYTKIRWVFLTSFSLGSHEMDQILSAAEASWFMCVCPSETSVGCRREPKQPYLFLFCFLFRAEHTAYGGFQARGGMGAVATATLDP